MQHEDQQFRRQHLETPERAEHRWSAARRSCSRDQRRSEVAARRIRSPEPRRSRDGGGRSRSRKSWRSGEAARRSRSRERRDSLPVYRRSRARGCSGPRGSDLLREVEQERVQLRELQDEMRRELNRLRSTVRDQRHSEKKGTPADSEVSSRRREPSPGKDGDGSAQQKRRRVDTDEQQRDRSRSPVFSTKDVTNILSSLKNLSSQPTSSVAPIHTANHRNILPEFDPSSKNQRIDIWLKKVNECATVYGWDDKTIIHFAMQKLHGLAKTWYESLPSILFTWVEWQDKLTSAFPCKQNYGQALEDMLKRKSKYGEAIEVYYYEKLALLNQCNIEGKRAVDCIIHGLTDRTMKSSATTLRCDHPEQLLQFLMSNNEVSQPFDRLSNRFNAGSDDNSSNKNNSSKSGNMSSVSQSSNISCYNCKEKGHPFYKCPKPISKCSKCDKMGHNADNCFSKHDNKDGKNNDAS